MSDEPRRLLHVVTDSMTVRLLMRGQLAWFASRGWSVGVICREGDVADVRDYADVYTVPMQREIAPMADLKAVVLLRRAIRRFRPEVVVASTPKAGLLGLLASWLARVPARVYLLRGLRVETATGWRRVLLRCTERLAAAASTRVFAVSDSLARAFVDEGLSRAIKISAPVPGSSNGVDLERFKPGPSGDARRQLGMPIHAPIVGFVGRLTRDKGVADLLEAFDRLRERLDQAPHLLLVGPFEAGDPIDPTVRERVESAADITWSGFLTDTTIAYRAMDVLAFPSRREGFPNAPLEAAASGVQVVGYTATGTVDAVTDTSGVLVPVGDIGRLTDALESALERAGDPEVAAACRAHARRFDQRTVWAAWESAFAEALSPETQS